MFRGPISPVHRCVDHIPEPPVGFPLMIIGTLPQACIGLRALKSTTGFGLTVSVAPVEFTVMHLAFKASLYWFPLKATGTLERVSC